VPIEPARLELTVTVLPVGGRSREGRVVALVKSSEFDEPVSLTVARSGVPGAPGAGIQRQRQGRAKRCWSCRRVRRDDGDIVKSVQSKCRREGPAGATRGHSAERALHGGRHHHRASIFRGAGKIRCRVVGVVVRAGRPGVADAAVGQARCAGGPCR